MKILVVEDDNSLREILLNFLEKEGYVVETAATLREAVYKTADYSYDCILLDMMLPDGSGMDVLKQLKAMRKRENVIIISARDSIDDKIAGLDSGADDYLAKPFDLSELNARIRSVYRRNLQQGDLAVEVGNVKVLPDKNEVYIQGNPVELTRKEYDILNYFLVRPFFLVSKSTLAESVWGDYIDQTDSYDFIYAQMKNLRKKLKEAGADIEIKAIYGFGYKLVMTEE